MEEGAKIGREHEQQQQQHGRVNGSGRVAAVGGGSGGGGDEIEIEVAAAAGASPSRQHGGLHGDVQAPTWKRFLAHVGPGFVISIAYLDPRRHLAELCMGEYPKYVKYCLWLLAELGVIAATIPGVLGTALAYNMLLHIPFWAGARKMEFTISVLMLVMATCFFMELGKVNPPAGGVIEGLFIPRPKGDYSTSDAVAMFGSLVVPHNLFLHSSLVLTRKMPYTSKGRKDASTFFLLENALALFIALLVNVAIVSISGTICANNLSFADTSTCSSLTLNSTYVLLKNILGKSSSTVYGVALLVSGQSCMVATSYAGQYIMQIVLSFVLPFALIPLIKFSSSCTNIGPYKNATSIIRIAWILSLVIIGINIYFFCTSFVAWLVHSDLPRVVNAIISSLVFPFMAAYIAALIYLAFRKVNLSDPFPTNSVSGEIEVQHIQIQEKQEDLDLTSTFAIEPVRWGQRHWNIPPSENLQYDVFKKL
uniref:Metal transporter n=1 Tax=Oryza rufipogon TaxID=4529 RepID=A0A0E0MWX4_ORYRU